MRAQVCVLAAVSLLIACPKKEEPKREAPRAAPATTEVEFFGTVTTDAVKVSKTVFVAMQEPCSPVPAEAHLYGQLQVTEVQLFAEFFPPQGSKGHLCAFGFDEAGRVVAFAAYGKNPVSFQGVGEVIFDHVDLKLEPLVQPAARPKGM